MDGLDSLQLRSAFDRGIGESETDIFNICDWSVNMGCLENSDLENSDPRPEKLRPSGVSKTQTQKTQTLGCLENSDPKTQTRKLKHIYTAWMPQADLFTVRRYSGITNICQEKKKQLAVLHTCNDHENYTQHLYIFFFSLSYSISQVYIWNWIQPFGVVILPS